MFQSLKKKFLLGSLIVVLTTTIGATFCYLIAETKPVVNIFKPFLDPFGDLRIEKTVEHPFGENYKIPEDLSFDFEVDLGEENANKEFMLSADKKVQTDENGVITLEVKPGTAVTISGIPTGTEATVTEKQNKNGFSIQNDNQSQSVEILSQETKTLGFVNTYIPERVQNPEDFIVIEGTKKLQGRDWLETDAFAFELKYHTYDEDKQEKVWKLVDTVTVTSEDVVVDDSTGNTALFGFEEAIESFSFDQAGIYSFSVSEAEGEIEDIQYTNKTTYFDVVVDDADMDGFLEIQEVTTSRDTDLEKDEESEEHTLKMEFVNIYSKTPEVYVDVSLEFDKKLLDEEGKELPPVGFTFELYSEDGKKLVESEPTMAAGEVNIDLGRFGKDDAGKTYIYKVKEKNAGKIIDGIFYDDSEYEVIVETAESQDGDLKANITGDKKTFTNTYNPKDVKVVIDGKKVYEGSELTEGLFAFELYETDEFYQIAKDEKSAVTVKNDADGNFIFKELVFEKEVTYYYVVKEDDSKPIENVTYDDTVYHVKIAVTDVGGKLEAAVEIMLEDGTVKDEICFVNIYKEEFDDPDKPDVPDDPDKPDDPNKPDQPDKPDTPDKPGDSDEPGEPGTTDKPGESDDAAKTGDQTNIFFYLTMFFGSGAIVLAIYLYVIKKGKEV